MASSRPTTWRSSCCAGRGLTDADLDAPVPRLGDLVGRRHFRLALAAAGHQDPHLGDSELDQLLAAALRALERECVVVRLAADAVRVADDDDLGRRPPRDLGEGLV